MGEFISVCVSAGPSFSKRNPLHGPRGSRIERYEWGHVGSILCFAVHHARSAVASFALKNGEQNPQLDNVQNVLLDQVFIITFLQPMNSDSVAQATTVTNTQTGKSVSLGFSWNKDFTELTLQPNGRYQIASNYHLQIADTAQAADGGTLKGWFLGNFSTVPLPSIVKVSPEPNSVATSYDGSLSI